METKNVIIFPAKDGSCVNGAAKILKIFKIKKASPNDIFPRKKIAPEKVAVYNSAGNRYNNVVLIVLRLLTLLSCLSSASLLSFRRLKKMSSQAYIFMILMFYISSFVRFILLS